MGRQQGTIRERTIDDARNDTEAAELRAKGWTYQRIADHQNTSRGRVHGRIQRALKAVPVEAVNELRQIECERLDQIISKAWDIVGMPHPYISQGRIFEDVQDVGPVLTALNLIRVTAESKRKLLGLDAPTRRIVEVVTEDLVDAELRALDAEYAALTSADPEG